MTGPLTEDRPGQPDAASAGPKLCPKIILEGTRLTRKTEVAFALNEHPLIVGPRSYRYHSPVISAEWCGFTNVPWGRGLINFLPEELELANETYRAWLRLFECLRYYSWIVDRFHISTSVYQRQNGLELDFAWLEERLVELGFRLVLCTRRPETFEAAREERLRVSGNPGQYDDLSVFIEEQHVFRDLVERSCLTALEVDVSDGDVERVTGAVAEWLRESGGLWQKGSVVNVAEIQRRGSTTP